jgi:hypothetical protein
MHPLCSLYFSSEIKNSVCNSTFYALLRSPVHDRVIAGHHVRCCHVLQYTNFGFYLSLLQIWTNTGCQTPESQAGNGIMFSLHWYYFKLHVQANYCMRYNIFHIRNQKAPNKRRAAPTSYIQVLLWTKLSTACGFENCEVLREGFHLRHTLHTVDHHTEVIFLLKSVKCLTNIILWELDVSVKYWYHYTLPQAHKISREKAQFTWRNKQTESKQERQVFDDARDNQVKKLY